jgi:ppGpp synthetase/RelA/SpoT-type nucleotidyltranferase
MKIPIQKQKIFIKDFEKIRPVYVDFALLLEKILQKAVNQLGYLAIIQVRVKNVASFSNKIIMKDKYQDPLSDVTDLCGGRVIVHFQSQVKEVCEFIKNNFAVDEANSLDLRSRLKVNEFGYRSVHYIITPDKSSIFGIPVNKEFRNLKAEIQVRTLSEHIWADISHDRIYKTELTIPEEWKREAARLSAILENADNTFASMSRAIDSVCNAYELQYETEKAKINAEKLETLIDIHNDKPDACIKDVLNLINVYNALNQSDKSIALIKEWIGIMSGDNRWQTRLKFEELMLDLTACSGNIFNAVYAGKIRKTMELLKKLDRLHQENHIPSTRELGCLHYRFGCLLQSNQQYQDEALDEIRKALELMPENPFYLTALSECMVMRNIDLSRHTITLFSKTLEKNITALEELIGLGIEAIPAWFAVGRCHFFLGNHMECINAYSNAVSKILDKRSTGNCFVISAEIARAERLRLFDKKLADQILLYLNLAMFISDIVKDKETHRIALVEAGLRKIPIKTPLIIVAGGASLMNSPEVDRYQEHLKELMRGFKGTIISGGTTAGIPGLVGRIKDETEKTVPVGFELLAYLPGKLPRDAKVSPAYDFLYKTASEEFSVLDVLICWSDIILSGIPPSEVIIIGINGGEIAGLEYRIALSLGAKVCLIEYSGRAASDIVQEKQWRSHPNLIRVPDDSLTFWAIGNQKANAELSEKEIETLAPLVHDFYREENLKKLKNDETDINKYKVVMDWQKLDPALQDSNKQQVRFYQHILKRVNLGIRKVKKPVLFSIKDNLQADDRTMLAKLEHARWNAERLLEGWRYGPEKDLAKKINPYLVSWERLDDNMKKYDYDPVDNIPVLMMKIGYEVYKTN